MNFIKFQLDTAYSGGVGKLIIKAPEEQVTPQPEDVWDELNKKQDFNMKTAVEWFCNEMENLRVKAEITNMDGINFIIAKVKLFEQAKEMEKEQMNNFFKNGIEYGFDSYHANELAEEPTRPNFEQYYNETFKSE